MIKKHPYLELSIDDSQKLFRYMDIYKLLYMLNKKSLYFTTLANMQDDFEGRLTEKTIMEWLPIDLEDDKRKVISGNIDKINTSTNMFLKVLCLSIADSENEILWNHYGHSEYSVCIQTTLERIKKSLISTKDEIHIGEIKYIRRTNYLNDNINIFKIASIKSQEYQAEHELRLFIMNPEIISGISIDVDLDAFIEKIIISPKCKKWNIEILKNIVSIYKLGASVEKSKIIYRYKLE